ncbi:hypothetical protein INN71_01820 [Nocardioides sp. ChNu-153]|uniref:hypothetical protein n=1 Tax=unclassified Nocardioides TaxID=2615069 RepID=UPI002405313E|nr:MULTISPECIES: hypothetical protein [unclassified Nocardioides]MDF9714750.1 hypothetical protein [Nocardioides sp. ChNu-99]MDN7120123.1 hypothetical protein [Nocardioides sp. ChNu-153]
MALEPVDPFVRATETARSERPEPPGGWVELSASVMARVRSSVLPSEPLLTFAADGRPDQDAAGSRTYVSERVVRTALRELLQSSPSHAPEGLRLLVDDGRLTGVEIDLVAAYGTVLPALGDAVRAQVLDLLRGLLGPDPDLGPDDVVVAVTDVAVGDPRLV